jgi:SsrA-binding protein
MPQITKNKRAFYDYEILEKLEAGLVLTGQEVKSVKGGGVNLTGAYVIIRGGEAYLVGALIAKYKFAGRLPDYDPQRTRKLLLKRKELSYLTGKSQEKGLTILPLSVYTTRGKIKVEIGVSREKKQFEKRETIKKQETRRKIRQEYGL